MAHKTYIRKVENSDKAILFIHGFMGSTEHFTKFIEIVPKDFSVYNILLKGHGGTVLDFAHASMDKWKKQVGSVVRDIVSEHNSIIIVAHSMGTFFAMDESLKHKDKIKALYLLQSPLKIGVQSVAVRNSIKCFFNKLPENDRVGQIYKNSHSVTLNKRIWEYIGWIPRYLELFSESARARKTIQKVSVPCYIFQSKFDELVSVKSLKFIPEKDNITTFVLEKSAHFIYGDKDYDRLIEGLENLIKNV